MGLIFPQTTNMDFHIGAALWFAARGCGHRAFCNHVAEFHCADGRGDHVQQPEHASSGHPSSPVHGEEVSEGASTLPLQKDTARQLDSDVRSDEYDFIGPLLSQVHEHRLRLAIATSGATKSGLQSWLAPSEEVSSAPSSMTAAGTQPRKRKPSHMSHANDAPELEKRNVCVGLPKEVMATLKPPPRRSEHSGSGTQKTSGQAVSQPQDYKCRRIAKPRCANAMCKMCCQKIQAFQRRRPCLTAMACAVKGHAPRVHNARDTTCSGGSGAAPRNMPKKTPRSCPQLPSEFWMEQKKTPSVPYSSSNSKSSLTSTARALVSGLGADEQLGGYGRHRTAFRKRGWPGLQHELDVDIQRLWSRNLGRDGRCISAHGKEARFPFLDEGVLEAVQRLPIHARCDPRLPVGVGDKLVLRIAAHLLGLKQSASRTKRAIQFGCRISKRMAAAAVGPYPGDDDETPEGASASASERGQVDDKGKGSSIRQTKGTTKYQPRSSKCAETTTTWSNPDT